jgi:hypothetical protein
MGLGLKLPALKGGGSDVRQGFATGSNPVKKLKVKNG